MKNACQISLSKRPFFAGPLAKIDVSPISQKVIMHTANCVFDCPPALGKREPDILHFVLDRIINFASQFFDSVAMPSVGREESYYEREFSTEFDFIYFPRPFMAPVHSDDYG